MGNLKAKAELGIFEQGLSGLLQVVQRLLRKARDKRAVFLSNFPAA
jgi:hypothetical protein